MTISLLHAILIERTSFVPYMYRPTPKCTGHTPVLNGGLTNEVNRRETKMEVHVYIFITAVGVNMVTNVTISKDIFLYRLCLTIYINGNKTSKKPVKYKATQFYQEYQEIQIFF